MEVLVRRATRLQLEQIIIDHADRIGKSVLLRLGGGGSAGDELRTVDVILGRRTIRGTVELPFVPLRCGGKTGNFAKLSDEVFVNILQFVPSHDRLNIFPVCKAWQGLRREPRLFVELSIGSFKANKSLGDIHDSGFLDASSNALSVLGRRGAVAKRPVNLSLLQHLRLRSGKASAKALRNFLTSLDACPSHLTIQQVSKKGSLSHLLTALWRKGGYFLRSLQSLSITDFLDDSKLTTLQVRFFFHASSYPTHSLFSKNC